ncbi:MAG TPA: ferritin-like domain-containing protein [Kofleriaceae bacterium]|nr:ferritin-like domain-containing protein [Kofleriaceae bacterium]
MDLNRMLEKCQRGQWRTEDLDWSRPPPVMSPEKERAVVQYFTDMAGIERLAAALFETQRAHTTDPVLARIFSTFVTDEQRHARVAELLAAHYDVRQLQVYRQNEELRVFGFHFLEALRHVPAEVATTYVTVGELLLDVALLRSIDAYVDDDMSGEAMERINRDESRHIAVDFYMTEHYASPEYQKWLWSQPWRPLSEHVAALWSLANMFRHARPFFRNVFMAPMERVDPTGLRIAEALARYQALIERPNVRRRPLPATIHLAQWLSSHRSTRGIAQRLARTFGLPSVLLTKPDVSARRASVGEPRSA